jgi:protein-S-isoprenylcysteine O-methyltransferase Ste14
MARTYRRGESFLLARHGRRSAVRPQVRSGCAVFSVGFVLAIWAITTIRRAGTRVETHKPTTAIVENGPYRFQAQPDLLHVLGPGRSCDGL